MELHVPLATRLHIRAPINFGAEALIIILLVNLAIIGVLVRLLRSGESKDGLMTANKLFRYEPAIFARLRWTINARGIIQAADKKVCPLGVGGYPRLRCTKKLKLCH